MQTAHAIHRPAAAYRQMRHVERLGRIVGILAAEREQVVSRNAEPLGGVPSEVLFDERRREAVETGGHGRVCGEEIARARRKRASRRRRISRS